MKPTAEPQWPRDRPLSPRTASINRIRELEILDVEIPIPGERLVEILPFGAIDDEDGTEWVAVRVSIDWPGILATVTGGGWVERSVFDDLPHLRSLILEAPSDTAGIDTANQWEHLFKPKKHRSPSKKQRLQVQPSDGYELLDAWQHGRRPVLRTIAFIERVLDEGELTEPEMVESAWHHLTDRNLGRSERADIITALQQLIDAVGHWEQWPLRPDDDIEPLIQWFEDVDTDDLNLGDDDNDDCNDFD